MNMATNNYKTIRDFGGVRLLDIEAVAPEEWDLSGVTHVRVSLPAGRRAQAVMEARGFIFGDRTLDVEIRPQKTKIDYGRLVRIKPETARDQHSEILDLALSAFPYDRRFHVEPDYDSRLAAEMLQRWVAELDEVMICRLKGEVAGFLALRDAGEKKISVHLAAVAEKYRVAGIALSLYAGAVDWAITRGYEAIEGRISSLNMPVMNLYAFLGASFANPRDIYLKKIG